MQRQTPTLRLLTLVALTLTACALSAQISFAQEAQLIEESDLLQQMLSDKLEFLIVSHPDTNVSRVLHAEITNELLFLSFDFTPIVPGTFSGLCVVDVEGYGPMPVLQVDPLQLIDESIPTEVYQLALSHEYMHWNQLMAGRAPVESFFLRPSGEQLDVETVIVWFEAEVEASLYEAEVAAQLGWSSIIPMCQIYADGGEMALRAEMAQLMAEIPPLAAHRALLLGLVDFPMQLESLGTDTSLTTQVTR